MNDITCRGRGFNVLMPDINRLYYNMYIHLTIGTSIALYNTIILIGLLPATSLIIFRSKMLLNTKLH